MVCVQITSGLYLGSLEAVAQVLEKGITHVVVRIHSKCALGPLYNNN